VTNVRFDSVKAAVHTFICLVNKLYIAPNVKAQNLTGSICIAGTIFIFRKRIPHSLVRMWQVQRKNEHNCVCVCVCVIVLLMPIFIRFFA